MDRNQVIAIFGGYCHEQAGEVNSFGTPFGQKVPVYLSGSVDFGTFLRADFSNNAGQLELRAAPMSSRGGEASKLKDMSLTSPRNCHRGRQRHVEPRQ